MDTGQRDSETSAERVKALEREVKELGYQRNTETGECVFCPGGARPPTQVMNAFVDDPCDAFGVEPICRIL